MWCLMEWILERMVNQQQPLITTTRSNDQLVAPLGRGLGAQNAGICTDVCGVALWVGSAYMLTESQEAGARFRFFFFLLSSRSWSFNHWVQHGDITQFKLVQSPTLGRGRLSDVVSDLLRRQSVYSYDQRDIRKGSRCLNYVFDFLKDIQYFRFWSRSHFKFTGMQDLRSPLHYISLVSRC